MAKARRRSTPKARRLTKKTPVAHASMVVDSAVESSVIGAPRGESATSRYSAEAWAALKGHMERVNHQRGVTRAIDWDELRTSLEFAAELYFRGVAPSQDTPKITARKTLDALNGCATTIRKLRGYLTSPELCDVLHGRWDFSSSDGSCRTIKAEKPLLEHPEHLARELADLSKTLEAYARELQEDVGDAKMDAFDAGDCRTNLIGLVFDVGHQLFGQVGYENGPLVTFLRLALKPVLGEATPSANALRTRALRILD